MRQSWTADRENWLDRYHQRRNIESVVSMMKAKFGDDLLGRSFTSQVNEALAKVVAHKRA